MAAATTIKRECKRCSKSKRCSSVGLCPSCMEGSSESFLGDTSTTEEIAWLDLPERGPRSTITSAIVFGVYCLMIVIFTVTGTAFPDPYPDMYHRLTYLICAVSFGGTVLILAELLYRTVLLVEEYSHKNTVRYRDFPHLINEVYGLKIASLVVGLIFVFLIMLVMMLLHRDFADYIIGYLKDNTILLLTQLVLNSVVLAMIGLRGPSEAELSKLVEKRHLSVAHGLAWSYYMGYLRLVAPDFEKRMTELQLDTGGGKVIPKMVILLPDTCHNPNLVGENDPNIEYVCDVKKEVDRAGKSKRSFSQPVYKITQDQQTYFCVVEYSASLLTLKEMCGETNSGLTRQEMTYQMSIFYSTLKKILQQHKFTSGNQVILLPYQDDKIKDDHTLSQLLVEKIETSLNPPPATKPSTTR